MNLDGAVIPELATNDSMRRLLGLTQQQFHLLKCHSMKVINKYYDERRQRFGIMNIREQNRQLRMQRLRARDEEQRLLEQRERAHQRRVFRMSFPDAPPPGRTPKPVYPIAKHPVGQWGVEFGDDVVPILPPNATVDFKSWSPSAFLEWVAMIIPQEIEKGLGDRIKARILGGYHVKIIAISTTLKQVLGMDDEPFSKLQSQARKILNIYRAEKFDRRMMQYMIDKNRMEDEREWYENMSRARAEWQARIREPVLPVTPHPLGRMGIEFGDEELVVPILPPGKNCNFKLWTQADFSSWITLVFPQDADKTVVDSIRRTSLSGADILLLATEPSVKECPELDDVQFSRLQSEARKIVNIHHAEKFEREMMQYMIDKNQFRTSATFSVKFREDKLCSMEDLRELIEQNEGVAKESAAHDEKGNTRIPEPIGLMNCCSTIASWVGL
ncbi:hypothetical protein L5515_010430 [Caenorhabditis briggsae]|uniref:Uncharacterized protein n=1 Tax=Caenorhabditis briggsae TaxID=6238 RepID=A0AAE9ER89_CAEBR|nr:hypothetical protein L5515_010430 [Caenorhabditis briggsae]